MRRASECQSVAFPRESSPTGPSGSGKSFSALRLCAGIGGKTAYINTEGDRTLFFDFLPMGLGKIKGCDIRVQLYTVPGQIKYSSTRKLVLRGVDGIVFVADSLEVRREKNMISLKDLQSNLKEYNKSIFKVPLIMQYNKRDLSDEGIPLMSVEQMDRDLNRQLKAPSFPGSAVKGTGVGITLKACLMETLKSLQREFKWAK